MKIQKAGLAKYEVSFNIRVIDLNAAGIYRVYVRYSLIYSRRFFNKY